MVKLILFENLMTTRKLIGTIILGVLLSVARKEITKPTLISIPQENRYFATNYDGIKESRSMESCIRSAVVA